MTDRLGEQIPDGTASGPEASTALQPIADSLQRCDLVGRGLTLSGNARIDAWQPPERTIAVTSVGFSGDDSGWDALHPVKAWESGEMDNAGDISAPWVPDELFTVLPLGSLRTWPDDDSYRMVPVRPPAAGPIGQPDSWAAVACGAHHVLALRRDGSLWAWGENTRGQLGIGTTDSPAVPQEIAPTCRWTTIAAGGDASFAISSDGSLHSWGGNSMGELGFEDQDDRHSPEQVGTDRDWLSVSRGGALTAALKVDHTLWTWGGARSVEDPCAYVDVRPVGPVLASDHDRWRKADSIGWNLVLAISDAGELRCNRPRKWAVMDSALAPPQRHPYFPSQPLHPGKFTALSCGTAHMLAVRDDGTLWAWGANAYGQLGLGDQRDSWLAMRQVGVDTDWVAAACGTVTSLAIRANGSLWAWGHNRRERLNVDWTAIDTGARNDAGPLRAWLCTRESASGYPSLVTVPARVRLQQPSMSSAVQNRIAAASDAEA